MLFGSGVIRKPCWPGNLLKPRKTLLSLSAFLIQHRPRINLKMRKSLVGYQEDDWTNAIPKLSVPARQSNAHREFFPPDQNFEGFPHGADGLIDCAAPPCINRAEAAAAPAPATPRRSQPV